MTLLDKIYSFEKEANDAKALCENCNFDSEKIGRLILQACGYNPDSTPSEKRLTSKELYLMNALRAKFVTRDAGRENPPRFVMVWKTEPKMYDGAWISNASPSEIKDDLIGKLHFSLFPTVQPGDCVGVNIIE